MISKGFHTGYIPIMHEEYMNCNWLKCKAGCGIAGSGRCFLNGHWWWKKCPEFEKDNIFIK